MYISIRKGASRRVVRAMAACKSALRAHEAESSVAKPGVSTGALNSHCRDGVESSWFNCDLILKNAVGNVIAGRKGDAALLLSSLYTRTMR